MDMETIKSVISFLTSICFGSLRSDLLKMGSQSERSPRSMSTVRRKQRAFGHNTQTETENNRKRDTRKERPETKQGSFWAPRQDEGRETNRMEDRDKTRSLKKEWEEENRACIWSLAYPKQKNRSWL